MLIEHLAVYFISSGPILFVLVTHPTLGN